MPVQVAETGRAETDKADGVDGVSDGTSDAQLTGTVASADAFSQAGSSDANSA